MLTLGLNPVQRARLLDAFPGLPCEAEPSPDALLARLQGDVTAIDLIVLSASASEGRLDQLVRRIRAERPRAAVVACFSGNGDETSTIPGVTQAGVHEVIIPGYNDTGARLRAVVMASRRGCAAQWTLRQLESVIPPRLIPFAELVLLEPSRVTSVPTLVAEVGVHRKTLYNWCVRTNFLAPAELIAWCRLAIVAYHLETTRCSVDVIARDVGYPSDTSLRNTVKRYTGHTASEVRERGGLTVVVNALREALAHPR